MCVVGTQCGCAGAFFSAALMGCLLFSTYRPCLAESAISHMETGRHGSKSPRKSLSAPRRCRVRVASDGLSSEANPQASAGRHAASSVEPRVVPMSSGQRARSPSLQSSTSVVTLVTSAQWSDGGSRDSSIPALSLPSAKASTSARAQRISLGASPATSPA